VATISGSGLLTVVGGGTTEIRAVAQPGGVQSAPIAVTVSQVATGVQVNVAAIAFGALGSTRQLSVQRVDSSGASINPLTSPATVVWSRLGPGTSATVSSTGLVTALATGAVDTAVATVESFVTKVPITVSQLVASVAVSSVALRDSLATTGRSLTYAAVARDSNLNTVPGLTPTWSSSEASVATVGASTGIATSVSDGTTSIRATIAGVTGSRTLTVRRYASTFTLLPAIAAISTPGGTFDFAGTARDSVDVNLPIAWISRSTTIATVSTASGPTTTVTGRGNGNTFLVMLAGTRADSAALSVSGQATAPLTAGVVVGDNFFRSSRNSSQNAAVDTIAVGGTVTWSWGSTSNLHNVQSILNPMFTSSGLQTSGTHVVTFNTAGTYQYDCQVHGSMTGRIVVR
jgi:plastocyanin